MVNDTPNLSTDFVKDMLAEYPAKEPKAVGEDGIRNLLIMRWEMKAINNHDALYCITMIDVF